MQREHAECVPFAAFSLLSQHDGLRYTVMTNGSVSYEKRFLEWLAKQVSPAQLSVVSRGDLLCKPL